MKHLLRCCACISFFLFCSSANLFAQTGIAIDKYLSASAKLTTIGSTADNLSTPQDLDFSPVPSRKNELWVINKGDAAKGGSVVIFYDAGKPTQWSEYRHDSHSAHFMLYPTALAMGAPDSAYFAIIGEGLNSNGDPSSTFMGPVLWDSDTTKFARINQNNWVSGQPLGSHIDMLHQSPYSMGIAFDTLNAYWVFDGYHGCLFHYDFETSHGYGNDDHSNGEILKYKEVKLKRIANMPSHMVVDKSTGWLYIVDNGNKRIVRVDTKSGQIGNDLTAPNEYLQAYAEMVGVKWQTVDSGFTNLSGIDYFDGRLIVGNYGTGEIRIYNTTTSPKPKYLGSIMTNDAGMMGLKIGPDSNIWYVNRTRNVIVKLTPGGAIPVAATLLTPSDAATQVLIPSLMTWAKSTGAISYHLQVSKTANFTTTVYDSVGLTGTSMTLPNPENSMTYYWRVSAKNGVGEGQWSSIWHFKTIGAKPSKLALTTPKDSALYVSTKPTFTWKSVSPVSSYSLQVSLLPTFPTTVVDQPGISIASYSIPTALAEKTTYYWRVKAVNDGTIGDWSDAWSFTTLDPNVSVKENPVLSSKIKIDEIYPNPSSANSMVGLTLSEPMHLRVAVIDLTGREVAVLANENYESGKHILSLNSIELPSGTYFYQFITTFGLERKPFIIRR